MLLLYMISTYFVIHLSTCVLINLKGSMGIVVHRGTLYMGHCSERKLPQLLTVEVPGNVGGGRSDRSARDGRVLAVQHS